MLRQILEILERLNLSYPQTLIGSHFPEILSLLSIVFGGSFLLFAWKHRAYFLGVTGFLVGGWAGLFLKGHLSPNGQVAPFLYLAVCAVAGAYLAMTLQRFVGMLLGGFTVSILMMVFSPQLFRTGGNHLATICMIFLLGGGLGAIFPKFFFVFNSSLIGAIFVTYGLSQGMENSVEMAASTPMRLFLHLAVFLPLFLFGIIYQMTDREGEPVRVIQAAPQPARVAAR